MQTRLGYLDGVRGVAILLVLLAHTFPDSLTVAGPLGVQIFFVLSGYLITTLLVSEVERRGGIDLPRFFVRRALRLLPALVVTVVLYVLVIALLGDPERLRQAVLGAVTGLVYLTDFALAVHADVPQELGHLWSLAVEEHFYIVWPLLVGLTMRRWGSPGLRRVLGIAFAASLPLGLAYALIPFIHRLDSVDFYFLPSAWVGSLVAGAFLAVAIPRWRDRRVPQVLSAVPLTLAGMALAVYLCVEQVWIGPVLLLLGIPLSGLVMTGVLARVILVPSSVLRRVLEWHALVRLGQISYGVYLLNRPVILLAEEWFAPGLGVRVVAAAVSVGLAWAMFRWVERPVLELKARWAPRPALAL